MALAAASLLTACSAPQQQAPAAPPAPPYQFVAPIREVMNSIIDPNVDVVWLSVGTTIERGKPIDRAPKTDEEWAGVRHAALIVAEAANLLMMPGRPVAAPGAGSLTPGVELAPNEVKALIDKNPAAWNVLAQALQESMAPALAAIDKKDATALFEAGERIDQACENCHTLYWYPNVGGSTK